MVAKSYLCKCGALYQREGCRARHKYGNFSALDHSRRSQQDLTFKNVLLEKLVERSELEKLANLARINVGESVLDDAAQSISEVLALVDQLQAINTDGVEPMAHPQDAIQQLRADEITEPNQREKFQAIAPQTEEGLYLVPKVIE